MSIHKAGKPSGCLKHSRGRSWRKSIRSLWKIRSIGMRRIWQRSWILLKNHSCHVTDLYILPLSDDKYAEFDLNDQGDIVLAASHIKHRSHIQHDGSEENDGEAGCSKDSFGDEENDLRGDGGLQRHHQLQGLCQNDAWQEISCPQTGYDV
ncbi:allograft inflammatory factor 1-like isoform X2 [Myxocyprinus asiaticus]|uniref:allograft inflammatory factor 1-like isoform X2 n=1 Tax=Myxocyprinus asiaticus TaxID=70543 RepID=UPI00222267B3|nr:allograft inflammatory factor 1-like isoform X2 [Myxocyprinus asiaticus]